MPRASISTGSLAADPPATEADSLLRAIAAAPAAGRPPTVLPGSLIGGKYRVDRRIGAGGMGVVYRATDVRLGRGVAIKLQIVDDRDVRRMRREARALARLSHPNVVVVLELGAHDEAMFIAMELVDGETARAWCARRPGWRAAVDVYVQAGRGLAAAHAAGVIHRDFKPDNVLVGRDGRARVVDFGLAAERGRDDALLDGVAITEGDGSGRSDPCGTPDYVAPERITARALDASADQFSFCVSLWEAAFGEHPFRGEDRADTLARIVGGRIREPDRRGRVPRSLREILLRGLAIDPRARWRDMTTLLDAIERTRRRGSRWPALIVIAGGAAIAGLVGFGAAPSNARCENIEQEIAALWTPARRDRISEQLADARPDARAAWGVAGTRVDAWLAAWDAAMRRACVAHVTADAPRLVCLDAGVRRLARVLDDLEAGSLDGVAAVGAIEALDLPARCEDEAFARVRSTVESAELRSALKAAKATASAHYDEADDRVGQVLAAAHELGDGDIECEALLERGRRRGAAGRPDRAVEDLQSAYFLAIAIGRDDVAVGAAIQLGVAIGVFEERMPEANTWMERARALLDRHPEMERGRMTHAFQSGKLYDKAGDLDAAAAKAHECLALAAQSAGTDALQGYALAILAEVARDRGQLRDAIALSRRALQHVIAGVGPEHRDTASAWITLGGMLDTAGQPDEARDAIERGVAIAERVSGSLGREHIDGLIALAYLAINRGRPEEALALAQRARARSAELATPTAESVDEVEAYALHDLGRYEEARVVRERLVAALESAFGSENRVVGRVLDDLATTLRALDRRDEAAAVLQRAMAIADSTADELGAADVRAHLGRLRLDAAQADAAIVLLDDALARFEQIAGPDDPQLGEPLLGAARARLQLGERARAIQLFDRAIAVLGADPGRAADRAAARFELARVLWDERSDRARASALAREALAITPADTAISSWVERHTTHRR
jgi:eukaryotic-like serine/threonine-protein kinase